MVKVNLQKKQLSTLNLGKVCFFLMMAGKMSFIKIRRKEKSAGSQCQTYR